MLQWWPLCPDQGPSVHTRGWISTCAGGMGHKSSHWKVLSGLLSHFGKHLEQIAFLELLQPEDTACPSGVVSLPMGEQLVPEQKRDIGHLVSWSVWEAQPGCLSWACSPWGQKTPPGTAAEASPWDKSTVNCKVDIYKASVLYRPKQKQELGTGCNPRSTQIVQSIKEHVSEALSPKLFPHRQQHLQNWGTYT